MALNPRHGGESPIYLNWAYVGRLSQSERFSTHGVKVYN